jgi:hypothetical protein
LIPRRSDCGENTFSESSTLRAEHGLSAWRIHSPNGTMSDQGRASTSKGVQNKIDLLDPMQLDTSQGKVCWEYGWMIPLSLPSLVGYEPSGSLYSSPTTSPANGQEAAAPPSPTLPPQSPRYAHFQMNHGAHCLNPHRSGRELNRSSSTRQASSGLWNDLLSSVRPHLGLVFHLN